MKQQTKILVIGGGITGCSLLYHLTQLGVDDCMLLEKHELTAGTTWHSAALISDFAQSSWQVALHHRARQSIEKLEEESGLPTGFHRTGSIRLALNAEQLAEGRRFAGIAKYYGIPCELISADEVKKLHPLVSTTGVIGATYTPDDGYVDPHQLTNSYAIAARQAGAEVHRHTLVTGLKQKSGGAWDVETNKGTVSADIVVNCAGIWGNEIAAMVGESLPLVAVELSWVATDAIPEVDALKNELPILRGLDGSYYLRQEREGVLIGVYEDTPAFWSLDGIPPEFGQDLLPGNLERLEGSLTAAMERVPAFATVGIKNLICGPSQRTPDLRALIGPVPGVSNFFSHVGIVAGFGQGSGLSQLLAQWIIKGRPDEDLWPNDLRRFGAYADQKYTMDRITESFTYGYSVVYPGVEHLAGRPSRTSAIYDRLTHKGALFCARHGWESPLMFIRKGTVKDSQPTFGKPGWFDQVAAECQAVHNNVGILDLTAMVKFEVSGPDTEEFLDQLCTNQLPAEKGCMIENLMLNKSGGIECYLNITRLADECFYLTGPSMGERHHLDWLQRHLPKNSDVRIENVTERDGTLLIAGPKSSETLAEVSGNDKFIRPFPCNTAQFLGSKFPGVRALRVNTVGEVSWELYHPLEIQGFLYDALMEAGKAYSISDFGLRAQSSLSLEMGIPRWKSELEVTKTPLDAGLERIVNFDKGEFIGFKALIEQRQQGPLVRLVGLEVEVDDGSWLWGDECILHNGQPIALTANSGFGHRVHKHLAMAYLPKDFSRIATPLQVEVLGQTSRATVIELPLQSEHLLTAAE